MRPTKLVTGVLGSVSAKKEPHSASTVDDTKKYSSITKNTRNNALSQISSRKESSTSSIPKTRMQPKSSKLRPKTKEGGTAQKLKQIERNFAKTHKMMESITKIQAQRDGSPMRTVEGANDSAEASSPQPSLMVREFKREPKPKITDFEIDKVIGVGHYGKVSKAWNKRQKRWVALKALKKESVAEMSHVEHVINEREILFYLQEVN
jgi:hypothetical protein